MGRLGHALLVMCAASLLCTNAYAGQWQYLYVPEHKMHLAHGPASTGTQGVTEIVNHSCHEQLGLCAWSMSVAVPCRSGEFGISVVVLPKLRMPGTNEEVTSTPRCGGPNSGLPGTFVYKFEQTEMIQEMLKVNGPVVIRVGSEKGPVMDVTLDFMGAGPVIAKAEAGLRKR